MTAKMDREALLESWRVTTGHLVAAGEALAANDLIARTHEFALFGRFLDHNELELALECIEALVDRFPCESAGARSHVALAARSMGLRAER